MNYILFNTEILVSHGELSHSIKEGDVSVLGEADQIIDNIDVARICVVDVDVLIAGAVEEPIEKKDSILVRKFNEFYKHEAYVIQDERIDNNLFQVLGIKEKKVREVYSLVPSERVETLIPYGVALRNTLINRKVDLNRTVVFVDVIKNDKLLTVFDGLKFSRTRIIVNNDEDILPDIKRSQIDFFKKNEEFLSKKLSEFVIVVNDQHLADELSQNADKIKVEYLNSYLPGMEGLIDIDTSIKYTLPEESLKKRKEIELKNRVTALILSLCVVVLALCYFLFNRVEIGIVSSQGESAQEIHEALEQKLNALDRETYRDDLKVQKSLNYGITYLSMLEIIPASYTVNTFKFSKSDKWSIEMTLFTDDEGMFDQIPRIKILKNAEIKDIFENNQPGKHLRITI